MFVFSSAWRLVSSLNSLTLILVQAIHPYSPSTRTLALPVLFFSVLLRALIDFFPLLDGPPSWRYSPTNAFDCCFTDRRFPLSPLNSRLKQTVIALSSLPSLDLFCPLFFLCRSCKSSVFFNYSELFSSCTSGKLGFTCVRYRSLYRTPPWIT